MSYKYKVLLIVAPLVLFLDQITKWWVLKTLSIGERVPVINGFWEWVHIRNPGAAFGILGESWFAYRLPFFFVVSVLALGVIAYIFLKTDACDRFNPIPMSLITAGVLGNFIDRVRFGNVVDFISLRIQGRQVWGVDLVWPAFNVADSAITLALLLMIVRMIRCKT